MNAPQHVRIDLSDARRLLVGGDVHGHLDRLIGSLDAVGYDADAGDRLVLLGDLLDRGPEVLAVHDWLLANPTVVVLVGNHDDMFMASAGMRPMDDHSNPLNLVNNGGRWLLDFAPDHDDVSDLVVDLIEADEAGRAAILDPRIVAFARHMATFPVAATVTTPWGRTVGLVHADVPRPTWAETVEALCSPFEAEAAGTRQACTWHRHMFDRMSKVRPYGPEALAQLDMGPADVDHVLLGHSIVPEPTTAGNVTWIDTGPYRGGPVTVLDVDALIDALPTTKDHA